MNPPEQAPALKQIYEARLELVRQNKAEVVDLKLRLEQATRRNEQLVAQMKFAKDNYEEAASKIVDLLDDNDEKEEEYGYGDYDERYGNASKHSRPDNSQDRSTTKNEKLTRQKLMNDDIPSGDDEESKSAATQHRTYPLKPTPNNYAHNMMSNEVVDLLDSDGDSDINPNISLDQSSSKADPATKRARSSSPTTNTADSTVKKESIVAQKRSKSSPPREKERESNGKPDISIRTENSTMKDLSNSGDEKKSSTNRKLRSSSTASCGNRSSGEGKSLTANKKRPSSSSSSSSALTSRIMLRPRPSDIPPKHWLKSSVGRTRQELNNIDDMVQYMGSCQFGQSVIVSKFGVVHAIVLNDEWNKLAQRNDEYQFWYVGLGPGRKRDARLVGAAKSSIPIFHAPKMEYTTKELFYVGHYMVIDLEELDPPIVEMEKERDMKITFGFENFDERLDSIIKRGPNRDE